jgi:hypothetical protein
MQSSRINHDPDRSSRHHRPEFLADDCSRLAKANDVNDIVERHNRKVSELIGLSDAIALITKPTDELRWLHAIE